MNKNKAGDEFFYFEDGVSYFFKLQYKKIGPSGNSGWKIACDGLGDIIYDCEILDKNIDENPLIRVKNEKHFLQLKIKYSCSMI